MRRTPRRRHMVAGLIGILMALVTILTVLGTMVAGSATRPSGSGAASVATAPPPTIVSASTCHSTVAVLGADMTAPQRDEVRGILGVDGGTLQLIETLANEEAQAQGLVPPELLLDQATSSVLFRPEPRGSGLTVSVNPAITLDTPRTYANALLTAGVTDASVTVAAPTGLHAPVLGTTALLGLLRAAQAACGSINQDRRNLAIREVVLTSQLAQQVGRDAAPILLTAAKANAVEGRSTDPAALGSILTKVSTVKGIRVPPLLEPATVAFLASLVSSGTYTRVAAGTPLIRPAGEHGIHVSLSGQGTVPPPVRPGVGTPLSGQPTQRPKPAATTTTERGTLLSAGPTRIGVQQSNGPFNYPIGPGLAVTRNHETSSLGALKKGDNVSITLNGSGAVTYIVAQSPGAPPQNTALPATAVPVATAGAGAAAGTGIGGLNTTALAALAGLILLLLVAIPLLLALLRRRRRRPRRTVTTAARTVSTTTVMPAVTPLPRPDQMEPTRPAPSSRERAVGIRPRQSPSQRKRRNRK